MSNDVPTLRIDSRQTRSHARSRSLIVSRALENRVRWNKSDRNKRIRSLVSDTWLRRESEPFLERTTLFAGAAAVLPDNRAGDLHLRDDPADTASERQRQHQARGVRGLGDIRGAADAALDHRDGWLRQSDRADAHPPCHRNVHHQRDRVRVLHAQDTRTFLPRYVTMTFVEPFALRETAKRSFAHPSLNAPLARFTDRLGGLRRIVASVVARAGRAGALLLAQHRYALRGIQDESRVSDQHGGIMTYGI